MIRKTIAFVLAGGKKPSLDILSSKRAKAAIPYGSIYRVIDFALSNLMHSEVSHVGVLTQYKPESLMDHIGDGEAWDWQGRSRGIKILPPFQRQENSDWYKGTADAIYQNMNFIIDHDPKIVMAVSGDHIYHLDYRQVIQHHCDNDADITVVVKRMPDASPGKFGMVSFDQNFRITGYEEKPDTVTSEYISLGIYLFKTDILLPLLVQDAAQKSSHDIGRNLISPSITSGRVYAYPFEGPWFYLGDVRAFWEANMELLKDDPVIALSKWGIETNLLEGNIANLPPTRFRGTGSAQKCRLANGCLIEGTAVNSIIFPGVTIHRGSHVDNSIVMNNVVVGEGTRLNEVIVDKDVIIGQNVSAGLGENIANADFPEFFSSGISVFAKGVRIASGTKIGKNVLVSTDITTEDQIITSGSNWGALS